MVLHESVNFLTGIMENKVLSVAVTVLVTVLLFGALILIHELGHYLTARLFGVTVKEFSVGMGPKIFGRVSPRTGILYALRALPVGGFVAMEGEDEASEDPNAFSKKKTWQRMIITVAGGAMNLFLGLILTLIYVLTMQGLYGTTVTAFPEKAMSNSCENALMVNDTVLKINGASVRTGQEVVYELFRAGSKSKNHVTSGEGEDEKLIGVKVDLEVLRNGEKVTLKDVLFPVLSENGMTYGLRDFYYNEEGKNFKTVIKNTGRQMILSVKMVYESLFDLITGRYGIEQVSGPVGTATVVGDALKQDFSAGTGQSRNSFIYLAMLVTVNLGLFNLLPVPALDGGRVFFQLIELIVRKPIPQKYEAAVHFVGIILLLALMALVTMKDIVGLFR